MEVEEAIGSRDTPQAKGDRFELLMFVRCYFPSRLLKSCYLDIISPVKVFMALIGTVIYTERNHPSEHLMLDNISLKITA